MAEKKKTQWTRYESTAPRTFREAAAKASKKSTAKRRVTTHSTTTADAASRRNSTPAWQKAVDADLRKRGFDPSKFTTAQKRSFLQGGAAPVNKSTGLGRGGVLSLIHI